MTRPPLTDFADRVYCESDLSALPIVRDERLYEDSNPPEKPDGSTATDADRAAGYNADDVTAFRERFEPVEQARAAYLRGEGRRWQRIGGQLHDLERGPDGLLVRR